MTVHIAPLYPDPSHDGEPATASEAGLGTLATEQGNLPLDSVDITTSITGLAAGVEVVEGFHNPFDVPLEATYIFPLPDRAAVTAMRMEAGDRVVEGTLKERGRAREEYDTAIAEGRRAAIAEEDRPDVFTMRVGNIPPGERVTVTLRLSQPLPYEDGAATFRFPLVVAPRYVPGAPLDEAPAGSGVRPDTDAVPDASRISPPVLLPGFPNPVRLSLSVEIDPGGLPLTGVRSSHAGSTRDRSSTTAEESGGRTIVRLHPGQRLDRDFVLRLDLGHDEASSLSLVPDDSGDEGTFTFTVVPSGEVRPRPRDVVLILDRSGSMSGWKIVAARRAAARIIDTLTGDDRFAVLSFDHQVERPAGLPDTLVPATDRNRFRAVEHLAGLAARGGTELLTPLRQAAAMIGDSGRDRVIVLITDGQVGNEDQVLRDLKARLHGVRTHMVGIDRAVNAGFLGRLAMIGQGRVELVDSEDRLDEAMEHIHHRIGAPLVTGLSLESEGLELVPDTMAPSRPGALFPGVPLVVSGRWRGPAGGALTVRGVTADGAEWSRSAPAAVTGDAAAVPIWARAHLRDLEDRYVTDGGESLEKRIVDVSLRFGVLCRFTAFVAVDSRVVTEGGETHRVVQPVEMPDGWTDASLDTVQPMFLAAGSAPQASGFAVPMAAPAMAPPPGGARPRRAPGRPIGRSAGLPHSGVAARARAGGALSAEAGGPPTGGTDVLADARLLAGAEVRALDAWAELSEAARWRALSDLRTRLDALVVHLRHSAVAEEILAPLVALAADLRAADERTGAVPAGELWEKATRVLAEFAEDGATEKSAEIETSPDETRERGARPGGRAFWKRTR